MKYFTNPKSEILIRQTVWRTKQIQITQIQNPKHLPSTIFLPLKGGGLRRGCLEHSNLEFKYCFGFSSELDSGSKLEFDRAIARFL